MELQKKVFLKSLDSKTIHRYKFICKHMILLYQNKIDFNIHKLFCAVMLLLCLSNATNAQTGMNFQGVARNGNGIILASQSIAVRLSVLQGSTSGNLLYQETKTVTTNAQGIFNIVIGDPTGATNTTGSYTNIAWQTPPHFIRLEMDPTAGTNFAVLGTTQLQYVAYAQFANGVAAENIVGLVPVARGGTGASTLQDFIQSLQLNNVNNTSDLNKPISTATQNVLNEKLNVTDTVSLSSRINLKVNISDSSTIYITPTQLNNAFLNLDTSHVYKAIASKESLSNKSTATDLGGDHPSDILYPTQKAVKAYVTANVSSGGVADGGITTIKLADGAVTDAKITSINGSKITDATTANIAPSINRNYVTDVQSGVLSNTSGINTGDETISTIKSKLSITTLSGVNTGDQTIGLLGDVTGSGAGTFTATLSNTGVTAGTFGSSTAIPVLTIDSKGRLTSINTSNIDFIPPSLNTLERNAFFPSWGKMILNYPSSPTEFASPDGGGFHELQIFNGTFWVNQNGITDQTLNLGDYYLGGHVGYILQPGDYGYDPNIQHGIIVNLRYDENFSFIRFNKPWYNGPDVFCNATSTELGFGFQNQKKIILVQGEDSYFANSYAAIFIENYTYKGMRGWCIPTKNDLSKIIDYLFITNHRTNMFLNSMTNGAIVATSSEITIDKFWAFSTYTNQFVEERKTLPYSIKPTFLVIPIKYF
jgi:hypothetical protein